MAKKNTEIQPKSVAELSPLHFKPTKLQQWTEDSFDTFKELMEEVAREEPLEWLKLYQQFLKIASQGSAPQRTPKVADKVVVNNTQINKLDSAAEIVDKSWREPNNLQSYEEIK